LGAHSDANPQCRYYNAGRAIGSIFMTAIGFATVVMPLGTAIALFSTLAHALMIVILLLPENARPAPSRALSPRRWARRRILPGRWAKLGEGEHCIRRFHHPQQPRMIGCGVPPSGRAAFSFDADGMMVNGRYSL
jgi:hypothetical protein